jgi:hypothetical protein
MIRKSRYRFSLGTNASVCPEIVLKRKDEIMVRFNRVMI